MKKEYNSVVANHFIKSFIKLFIIFKYILLLIIINLYPS